LANCPRPVELHTTDTKKATAEPFIGAGRFLRGRIFADSPPFKMLVSRVNVLRSAQQRRRIEQRQEAAPWRAEQHRNRRRRDRRRRRGSGLGAVAFWFQASVIEQKAMAALMGMTADSWATPSPDANVRRRRRRVHSMVRAAFTMSVDRARGAELGGLSVRHLVHSVSNLCAAAFAPVGGKCVGTAAIWAKHDVVTSTAVH
jgi:hypothetical protein